MKTIAHKIAVLIAVTFLTISLNAQNTKEFKSSHLNQRISKQLYAQVGSVKNDLTAQFETLIASVKYSPADFNTEGDNFVAPEYTADYISAVDQLEESVRFYPESLEGEIGMSSESEVTYLQAAKILEESVKYRPSDVDYKIQYQDNELTSITEEIAKTVKYQPSSDL